MKNLARAPLRTWVGQNYDATNANSRSDDPRRKLVFKRPHCNADAGDSNQTMLIVDVLWKKLKSLLLCSYSDAEIFSMTRALEPPL